MGFNSGFKGLNKSILSIKCKISTPHITLTNYTGYSAKSHSDVKL